MRSLWSRLKSIGFRGQVSVIVLLGLLLSQILAAALYFSLLPRWRRELRPEAAVSEIALASHLLDAAPAAERQAYSVSLSDARLNVHWNPSLSPGPDELFTDVTDEDLREQVAQALGKPIDAVEARPSPADRDQQRVIVRLKDNTTLRFLVTVGGAYRLGAVEQTAICVFFLLVFGGLWIWITWMVNAPLSRFARAAERVGRDIRAPALAAQGPAELRRAIRAFNDMQHRLQSMLEDRTRMLGAVSHDLRTPLTRLRLRVETARSGESIENALVDIESMESMLASAFAFIRGVDDGERAEIVDLNPLIQTVCDTVSDLGGAVLYEGTHHCRYACRPNAMMRALTNVVWNAVKYGGGARVELAVNAPGEVVLQVDDEGPGIPDEEKGLVFEPFYRRPATQALDSAGLGLGLSIARSIVLGHGGTIELEDRMPRGLRVRITLPWAGAADEES